MPTLKLAIKIDQDLPFNHQAFTTYIQSYPGVNVEVKKIERSNYGIGSDCMVILTQIETGLKIIAALKTLLELPGLIHKIPYYCQEWEKFYHELTDFTSYIEKQYKIASYPVEIVFANAINSIYSKIEKKDSLTCCGNFEVATRHGGNPEIPNSYDTSRLIYWNFAFSTSRNYYFQVWDSQIRLLSELVVDEDPRTAERDNTDIRVNKL